MATETESRQRVRRLEDALSVVVAEAIDAMRADGEDAATFLVSVGGSPYTVIVEPEEWGR